MYQFIGVINDEQVGGLESLLNYMNEQLFNKDDPAINEHHYNITKRKQYNEDTHNIYDISKTKIIYTIKQIIYIQMNIITIQHNI